MHALLGPNGDGAAQRGRYLWICESGCPDRVKVLYLVLDLTDYRGMEGYPDLERSLSGLVEGPSE